MKEPGKLLDQRRLPRPRGTGDSNEASLLNLQVDSRKRLELVLAPSVVAKDEILGLQHVGA